jgi:hypothetical protein
MTPAAIVRAASAAGVRIKVEGDRLVLSALARLDDRILDQLRSAKPMIVEYLRSFLLWDEDDWNALYDERVGIMEFDGGLARAEAEERAREEVDVLRQFAAQRRA